MFKKGRKREAKGLAVVYFIIGLIILFIILTVIYIALDQLDYTEFNPDPSAPGRSYVEVTSQPDIGVYDAIGDETVDLTQETPEPTAIPTPTPSPTPTPTPTPEPTPSPTPIPQSMVSAFKANGFTLPNTVTQNVEAAITKCYVSQVDNDRFMYLAGYAYVNDAKFDGEKAASFLIVNSGQTSQKIAYKMNMKAGVSGVTHDGALCKNPGACDFECVIDVGQNYKDDIYNLGVVIGYKKNGNRKPSYFYYAFPTDISFTVHEGKVVTAVTVPEQAQPAAIAASPADAAMPAGAVDAADATAAMEMFEDADTAFEDDNFLLDGAEDVFADAADTVDATTASLEDNIVAEQMAVG